VLDQPAAAVGVPRPEYPPPQLTRPDWHSLNGTWSFEIDRGDSGEERGLRTTPLDAEITVPFAPESVASGIGDVDFMHAVWYRRTVTIPAEWAGRDVLLHFGAVDHDATVWVNDVEVARHRGGFTSFTADLGPLLRSGVLRAGDDATVVVRARDTPSEPQARGKQSIPFANMSCNYTRTTGIWQSVWLEPVDPRGVADLHVVPHLGASAFSVEVTLRGGAGAAVVGDVGAGRGAGVDGSAVSVRATLSAEGTTVATASASTRLDPSPTLWLAIPGDQVRAWSTSAPFLYDLVVEVIDDATDTVLDTVTSYAGLRSITVDGQRILINGEPDFQRLVLDQGYWPDTLMTAPSDEALRRDVELGIEAGFNGARLHQKVFEERYLYHADRLGYLVWGEFGDWGVNSEGPAGDNQHQTASFVTQWTEAVRRDRNHPSIVGWCPLNETWQRITDRITVLDDVTHGMVQATRLADGTRPVLDASGYSHRVRDADVYDSHCYEQDPAAFRDLMAPLADGNPYTNDHEGHPISVPYAGQPYFCSEYGGIWWNEAELTRPQPDASDPERATSWGYGQRVGSVEEWHARFQGLTDVLLDDPRMFGYCYTQLTDTFQEENGIYDFDRRPKFDTARVRAVQERVAAYEASRSAVV
jgi:beta-galactosidase/beta-glucuronidase